MGTALWVGKRDPELYNTALRQPANEADLKMLKMCTVAFISIIAATILFALFLPPCPDQFLEFCRTR